MTKGERKLPRIMITTSVGTKEFDALPLRNRLKPRTASLKEVVSAIFKRDPVTLSNRKKRSLT